MAELIVAELAGKAAAFIVGPSAAAPHISARSTNEQMAVEGAMALGIARPEAERLLDRARQVDPALATTESFLREMLRLRTVRT